MVGFGQDFRLELQRLKSGSYAGKIPASQFRASSAVSGAGERILRKEGRFSRN